MDRWMDRWWIVLNGFRNQLGMWCVGVEGNYVLIFTVPLHCRCPIVIVAWMRNSGSHRRVGCGVHVPDVVLVGGGHNKLLQHYHWYKTVLRISLKNSIKLSLLSSQCTRLVVPYSTLLLFSLKVFPPYFFISLRCSCTRLRWVICRMSDWLPDLFGWHSKVHGSDAQKVEGGTLHMRCVCGDVVRLWCRCWVGNASRAEKVLEGMV